MANNRVQVKRTSTSGRTPNTTGSYATNSQYISAGELALNMADGILYSSNGSDVIVVGANLVNQRITNSISIDNNKSLRFQTVNTSAYVGIRQQSDDNFVLYTTNTAYGERAVWSIFANSVTSNISFTTPAHFNANVGIATGAAIYANGGPGSAGQVLSSNGSAVYWATPSAASVNVSAQYAWTNTHTFSANVSFTGNGIGLTTNTAAIYFNSTTDANWKMGRNTNAITKWIYTNNSVDIAIANSNLEGFVIGNAISKSNTYFETGHLGTYIAGSVTVGNSASNSTINSTAFSGSANNTTYLNGQLASYYTNATNITTGALPYAQIPANIVNTTGSFTLSGNTTLAGTNTVISSNLTSSGANTNISGFLSATGGSKISVMENQDGGNSRGIFLWNDNDTNWGIYMSQSGVNKSLANATASAGLNGSSTYAVRFRAANAAPTDQAGFIWENNYETALMQLEPTNGDLFVRRNINAASFNVGTAFTANATLINAAAINITGQVNTATFYATTSANVGTFFIANSTGISTPGNTSLSGGTLSTNTTHVVIATTAGLFANGSDGNAGDVLTSNGTAAYWSPAAAGVNTAAQYSWTNTHTFNSNTTVGNATFANTFLNSYTGISNPQSLTAGVLQTSATLNTLLVGPYTISSGNSLVITTGSRVVII